MSEQSGDHNFRSANRRRRARTSTKGLYHWEPLHEARKQFQALVKGGETNALASGYLSLQLASASALSKRKRNEPSMSKLLEIEATDVPRPPLTG